MRCVELLQSFAVIVFVAASASTAAAQDAASFRHGVAIIGTPKYQPDFAAFDYVDVDAPKTGTLRMSATGTYDSFNPVLDKGELAPGITKVFDTLLKDSEDEISVSYGLLAQGVSFPDDVSSATFRLRPEAKWADGRPVTVEDVIFSFEMAKEHNPMMTTYYSHVISAEKTGERDVTFRFDQLNN
eukprot:gene69157-94785_t